MSRIPDELIEQVRDSADLVGIVGESIQLKRTGTDWRGPCPFHGGQHRNFAVIPRKGMYYCYVCHEAGDIFTFLMKRHGLDYPSAVREVARRVGISIPERSGPTEGPDPREPLYTAAAAAQAWFAAQLRENPEAKPARTYLESRDIPLETAGEHGLGYAPRSEAIREAMRALGIAESTLLEAGLLHRREDGSVSPRFRQRLLFPIHDLRGRVVGFGGRSLDGREPKYLNSPETPIFHKGGMLYNLHHAKQAIRREGAALLVEGYFDVLRLLLAGVDHVVAPMGTALTPEQAGLLKRFTPLVVLLYDSDAAGLRATFRTADECLRHRLRVKVATLPEGQDPDSLVREQGASALQAILQDALDPLERKIQLLERRGWFEGLEHRREALDRLLATARAAADPIARDLYLARIAERTGVSRPVLEQELEARPAPSAAPAPPLTRADPPPGAGRPARPTPGSTHEAQLLAVMLSAPGWRERGQRELTSRMFQVSSYREVFEWLAGLPPQVPLPSGAPGLSPRATEVWQRLLERAVREEAAGLDRDELFAAALEALRARELARTLPPVTDIEKRQTALNQLSAQERHRLLLRKAARRSPTDPSSQS
jgi:DNA primase